MTNTDTAWTSRLASVMPTNFMDNITTEFKVGNNTVLSSMMNMIGRTIVSGPDDPANPFAKYDKPLMEFGTVIQDYKVKYATPGKYDPEATDPFTITKNPPISYYYTQNDAVQYSATIYDREFKKAFTGQNAFDSFVSAQMDAMTTANTLDKRTKWKKYLSAEGIGVEAEVTTGTSYANDLLDTLREYANNLLREPSTAYNSAGDTAVSSDIDIIMKRKDKIAIDKVLSGVYNMDKLGIEANILLVDDFATPAKADRATDELVAIVCDSRALAYTPTQITPSAQYNGKGLYTNYYQTIEGVYSIAKYRNLVQVFAKAGA